MVYQWNKYRTKSLNKQVKRLRISHKKINKISGGQCAKVILAKLLLEKLDVLLLDELTNFLDTKHIN
mgnify:CR=1 FL=1